MNTSLKRPGRIPQEGSVVPEKPQWRRKGGFSAVEAPRDQPPPPPHDQAPTVRLRGQAPGLREEALRFFTHLLQLGIPCQDPDAKADQMGWEGARGISGKGWASARWSCPPLKVGASLLVCRHPRGRSQILDQEAEADELAGRGRGRGGSLAKLSGSPLYVGGSF